MTLVRRATMPIRWFLLSALVGSALSFSALPAAPIAVGRSAARRSGLLPVGGLRRGGMSGRLQMSGQVMPVSSYVVRHYMLFG